MSREFRSLLLKEWAERRQMLWFGIVYMMTVLGYCIAYEIEYRTRAFVAAYYTACLMFSFMGSVLLAMTTATGEYSRRTLTYSASLPISLRHVAWARLAGMWGCLLVPMILGSIIVTLILWSGVIEQAGLRSDDVRLIDRPSISRVAAIGFLWTTTLISVVSTLQLSTLISWLGTRCRNEGTVGLIGAVVVLFTFVFLSARSSLDSMELYAISDWIGGFIPQSMAICCSYGEWDGSSYQDLELAPLIAGPVLISLVVTVMLGALFARSFGCRSSLADRSVASQARWRFATSGVSARLGIRWHSPSTSLIWLTARQSIPLSLCGLLIAIVLTVIDQYDTWEPVIELNEISGMLPSNTWHIGILWATVVAVSVFSSELTPNLEQFWRSRAISPKLWFWTKFVVGLIAVTGVLDGIPALVAWNSPVKPQSGRMGIHYLACMPMIHAQVYAMTVAAICLIRRPIPAAIAALIVTYVFDSVLNSIPYQADLTMFDVFNRLDRQAQAGKGIDLLSEGYPIACGLVAVVIVGATILARRSVVPPVVKIPGLSIALLIGLCSSTGAQVDGSPTGASISAKIRQREDLVNGHRIRLKAEQHYHDDFYVDLKPESTSPFDKRNPRRPRPIPASINPPRDELTIAELIERGSLAAYSIFEPDGSLRSWKAFDGTIVRGYTPGSSRYFRGDISEVSERLPIPFLTPERLSQVAVGGSLLIDILESEPGQSITQREVDGEQLIDVRIFRTYTAEKSSAHEPRTFIHRYHITINASRHYWPEKILYEISRESDGQIVHKNNAEVHGWVEAGPLVYPRVIEQVEYRAKNWSPEQTVADKPLDNLFELKTYLTLRVEVLELAVAEESDDKLFAPAFPVGTATFDHRDKKVYEAGESGAIRPYRPTPAGFRGAVFAYHILWISAAVTCLFRRRNFRAHYAMGRI